MFSNLLAKTEYYELSDVTNVEPDAFTVVNHVFESLVYVPEIMGLINSDKALTHDYLSTLKKRKNHMISFGVMNEALESAFDVECHINESKFWLEILEELWPKYMLSASLPQDNYFPCQMTRSFACDLGGLRYSELWSHVLATDIFDAFNEVGFNNKEQIKNTFEKYRTIFLEPANMYSTNEKFRRFRGRNPSTNPFIKTFGSN